MTSAVQEARVKRGVRVGFMLTLSDEHMALYLATSRIGSAAIPFSVHLKSTGIELQLFSSKLVANLVQADVARAGLLCGAESAYADLARGWTEARLRGRPE